MHQNSKHINQDLTLRWNKMSTQQQVLYWNAGATEIQQLNPGGPDHKQSIEPQPTLKTSKQTLVGIQLQSTGREFSALISKSKSLYASEPEHRKTLRKYVYAKWSRRSASASTQSDKNRRYPPEDI